MTEKVECFVYNELKRKMYGLSFNIVTISSFVEYIYIRCDVFSQLIIMMKSLQSIIQSRRNNEFVGRKLETQFFQQNKNLPLDTRKFIISIYGQGGIGKTTLVRKIIQENDNSGISVYCDENQKTPLDVLSIFLKEFAEKGYPMKRFAERFKKYLELKEKIERDPELPKGIPSMIGEAIGKFGLNAIKEVPGIGLGVELIGAENITKKAGELSAFVVRKLTNKDDVKLALEPTDTLTPLFLEDLNEIIETKHVVIAFDTFEHTSSFIEQWLLKIIDGYYGEIRTNFTIVIAGRHKISSNWLHLSSICEFFELDLLSIDEAKEYLHSKGFENTDLINKIIEISQRLPLWLCTIASQNNIPDEKTIINPSSLIVDRFLKWDANEEYRDAAIKCSLPRTFNKDVLEVLIPNDLLLPIYNWLKSQPFVRQNSQHGWSYHQIVRKVMVNYLKEESEKEWRQTNENLSKYYQGIYDGTNNAIKSSNNPYLEILFHEVLLDDDKSRVKIFDSFLGALATSEEIAAQIISIAEEAHDLIETDTLKTLKTIMKEGLEYYYYGGNEKKKDFFVEYMNEIESTYKRYHHPPDKLHFVRGMLRYRSSELSSAHSDFTAAIELNRNEVSYYLARASAYTTERNYEKAVADLQVGLSISPSNTEVLDQLTITYYYNIKDYSKALEYANKLVSAEPRQANSYHARSRIYRSLKEYDNAIADITEAVKIAPKSILYLEMKASIYEEMGKVDDALCVYGELIAARPEYDYNYASRAQFLSRIGKLDDAILDLTTAINLQPERIKSEKNKDERRFKIGTKVVFRGASNWYEQRGDIYIQKKEYDNAINDFQLQLTEGARNRVGTLHCKIAMAYRDVGNRQTAKNHFQLCVNYDGYRHDAPDVDTHKTHRAHAYMELENYQTAFELYNSLSESDPEDVNYLFWKSLAEERLDKLEDSLRSVEKVLITYPEAPDFVIWHKANILKKLNLANDQLHCYDLLLTRDNNNLEALVKKTFLSIEISGIKNDEQLRELETLLTEKINKEQDIDWEIHLAELYSIQQNKEQTIRVLRGVKEKDITALERINIDEYIWASIKNEVDFLNLFENTISVS